MCYSVTLIVVINIKIAFKAMARINLFDKYDMYNYCLNNMNWYRYDAIFICKENVTQLQQFNVYFCTNTKYVRYILNDSSDAFPSVKRLWLQERFLTSSPPRARKDFMPSLKFSNMTIHMCTGTWPM